jgi:ABC-type sugar transport system ATPase subunit
MNFLAVTPTSRDGRDVSLAIGKADSTGPGSVTVRTRNAPDDARSAPVEIGIRPEHIAIVEPGDARAQLSGVVQLVERLGNLTIAYVATPAGQLVVEGGGEMAIRADDSVGLVFDASRTHMFDSEGRVA